MVSGYMQVRGLGDEQEEAYSRERKLGNRECFTWASCESIYSNTVEVFNRWEEKEVSVIQIWR